MSLSSKTYHIACHCQEHVLTLTLPSEFDFTDNGVCDCSHCLKRRIVWGVAPKGTLEVVRGVGKDGAAELAEYRFGEKNARHKFCPTCGTHLLGMEFDKDKEIMYNMRAIRDPDFDLWALPMTLYSGLNRPPEYTKHTLGDLPGAAEYLAARAKTHDHPTQVYTGSCHCQAIKFAVVCQPLEEIEILDCSCSICLGNGVLWIYPGRQNTFFHPHQPDVPYTPQEGLLTEYTFGPKRNAHYVCKKCGCQVFEYGKRSEKDPRPIEGLSGAQLAARPSWVPENGWNGSYGLNITLLNDIGTYLADALQLKENEGKLNGLKRDASYRFAPPPYKLSL